MKRKTFFATLGLLFFSFSSYAQNNINWFTTTPESHTLGIKAYTKIQQDFNPTTFSIAFLEKTDMKELVAANGIEFSTDQLHITSDIQYAPTIWSNVNAGLRMINHFNWNFNNFFEYDLIAGLYFSYKPVSWFNTSASALYQLKNAWIKETYKDSGVIINTCPAFSVSMEFIPLDWLSIKSSISSFDDFRYFVFFSPDFKLDTTFKINENTKIAVSTDFQTVDFFTLSANLYRVDLGLCAYWSF